MARRKEVTSTEKLLDIIRDVDSTISPGMSEYTPIGTPVRARPEKILKSPFFSINYWHSRATVGVDINHNALRLVKIAAGAEEKRRILDYRMVPLPPEVAKDRQQLSKLIAASLSAFCGIGAKVNIWACLPAINVDVRSILIPRVPLKQIPTTIYWHAKKEGLPVDDKENILDYEVYEEIFDQGKPKLSVMVYSALTKEVEEIKQLFAQSGWALTGVTIAPFAIQNLLRTSWLKTEADTIAILFIGNDFSRIDIYDRGKLLMTRGIKAGTTSLAESLSEEYNTKLPHPSPSPAEMAPLAMDQQTAKQILENLCSGYNLMAGISASYNLTEGDVLPLITPALDRLTRQVERTFDHYASSPGRHRVQALYCSSPIGAYRPILTYINSQIGLEVDLLDPPMPLRDKTGLDEAGVFDRVSYGVAIGLALADNRHTPNMIFTYKDKIERENTDQVNKGILISFLFIVVFCTALYIYLGKAAAESKASWARLEKKIQQINPPVDETIISKQFAELQQRVLQNKAYGDRNLSLAMVAELAALTPLEVNLISVVVSFPNPATASETAATKSAAPAGPEKKEETVAAGQGNVVIEGLVKSASKIPDMVLAEYALRLEKSPLFSQAVIQKSTMETSGKNNILHFSLQLKFE